MSASKRFVWPSCCDCFERTGVGAYRIRPSRWRNRMFDGGDVFAINMSNHPVQPPYYPWNNRTGVGAYRIRPSWRGKSTSNECVMFVVIIPFSPTWGRMRYAPTHVRLISGFCWVMYWFRFRSHQGVCDTPLHLFDWFLGLVGLLVGFIFAHIRAYAIRPYTCSMKIECLSHKNFTSNDFC